MKPWRQAGIASLAVALSGAAPVSVPAVDPGDDRAAVVAELGQPVGAIHLADEELLYFDRGSVRLRGGVVTEVRLVTAEEARRRRAAEAAAASRAAAARKAQSARRKSEGEALLRSWLEDPAFRAAPLPEQAARWEEFARRYPEIEIAAYLSDVTRRMDEQRAHEAQERRIAMLEFRAMQAEQAARAAEEHASRLPPYMMAPGGRTIYYVQPWTVPGGAYGTCRDGAWRPAVPRATPSGGSSSWPYNFGMRESPVGISPRRPGMPW
jgi:hypothetical protein